MLNENQKIENYKTQTLCTKGSSSAKQLSVSLDTNEDFPTPLSPSNATLNFDLNLFKRTHLPEHIFILLNTVRTYVYDEKMTFQLTRLAFNESRLYIQYMSEPSFEPPTSASKIGPRTVNKQNISP